MKLKKLAELSGIELIKNRVNPVKHSLKTCGDFIDEGHNNCKKLYDNLEISIEKLKLNEYDYHSLGKEIGKLVNDPEAMKGISFEKNMRKLGFVRISKAPIKEHIKIDLKQYAEENGYWLKPSVGEIENILEYHGVFSPNLAQAIHNLKSGGER